MSRTPALSPAKQLALALITVMMMTTSLITIAPAALASPGGIDGCFFRDLNGTSTMGDAFNPGANGEVAFTQPISVTLTEAAGSPVTITTDPGTGCFDFSSLADGDYQIDLSFPAEYYASPVGPDNVFAPGPPPVVAGDPFTASYNLTFTAGDDVSLLGAVSGLPELSLGYFVTPDNNVMIETGTGLFDTTDNCPVQVPGDDCGTYDNVVRTNDVTTIGYTVTADNIPDGDINPLTNVVLEQTVTPNPGAVVDVPSLHPSCLTAGVSPVSNIAVDPDTGVIMTTCNLGPKDNGTSILPMYIRSDGRAENGSSFSVASRVYTADDRAQVFDASSTLAPEEIFISAAPRFDITKDNDSTNPFNRVVYYQTTQRENAVTGETEYGVNYRWDLSVLYDGGAKGQAALAGDITFSDVIPAEFTGWQIVACYNTPYGNSGLPNDGVGPTDWGDTGTWDCAEDRVNNEIDITVTGADTDGNPIPTQGSNGTGLESGPFVAFAGSVQIWYPLSDFYKTVDSDWDYGDAPITGDYNLSNFVDNFDPVDNTGQSNFGDDNDPGTTTDIEPLGNNDRELNVAIYERGGFSKHVGSYEWADERLPDGARTGTESNWPCNASHIPLGSLIEGQSPACSSGDGPVQAGQKASFWFWLRNDGTFPWDGDTPALCDAFDNSTMTLTTWTGGEPVYVRTPSSIGDNVIIEYATASFNDDVTANDWTNQLAAVRDCTAPNNDWSEDPYSFDADPDRSLEMIGMIRVRLDATEIAELLPSEYFQVTFPVEIRDTYNGGPRDGQPIEVGTYLANNANRTFGTTDYSATYFDAEAYTDSPWGDRLIYNRHQVRITKATSIDPTSPTDDDLYNVQGSDTVVWWLQPAVTSVSPATATNVQVVDTLPAGITFDSFCQASQAYPDPNVTLTSVTPESDGTTTLLFDLGDRTTNLSIGPIPVCTTVDNFLEPGTDLINYVEISSDGDVSPESTRSDDRTISVVAAGEFQLVKEVDAPLELQLDTQTYNIGWRNLSSDFDFSPPDVIDVWPYNGDATNPLNQRSEFDSRYSGSYELTDWMDQPTTILDGGATEVTGGTWYYSSDDPATIPYDADDAANDLAVAGGVNWCTQAELTVGTAPCDFGYADSSAVRFVQSDILLSKSTVTVGYTFQAGTVADPNQPADRYVNRFAARTDSVDDLIRSNEVLVQVLSMNIGDLVFLDADVDGKYTDGVDVPVSGTEVQLWRDNAGTMEFQTSTNTDGNGRYVFIDLLQGTYEIRIPDSELSGGTLDTFIPTVLPLPADNDGNEDVDQQAYDSGLGYTTSGPVELSANTVVDPPLGLEPTGDNLFNLGNPFTYDNLTNFTVDLGFRGDPDVQIVKEICDGVGTCDLTTAPLDPSDGWVDTTVVPFTDTATWRISVINTGYEVLTDLAVDDDIEDSCDRAVGEIADLGVGETSSWICSTTNVVEDQLNTAAVSAIGKGSLVPVSDDDTAAVETPPTDADIRVTKYVNGNDAQSAPGVYINPGDPVTFTYEVTTGTGIVPLSNVTVMDNNGTSLDATDDFAATYVSGDTDDDDRLDLDETWLFQATGFTAVQGQYTNWATATGLPVAPGLGAVDDLDPAHYFGVVSGLDLTKFVQQDDANTAPGVLIAAGDAVTFTYSVENTGNAALTVTSFTDDAGTSADNSDDWTPTYVSGDTNSNDLLDVTETWLYQHTGEIAASGQYTNLASIVAEDVLGNTLPDSDPANYFGADPSLSVEKSTNTVDADVTPVPLAADAPIVWEYVVVNTGNVPVTNPRVSDDNGTAADLTDDFFATYVSGDANNDGLLDVSETWIFRATGTATESTYRNDATATGRGPSTTSATGSTVTGESLTDNDPSGYVVPEPDIGLTKYTNSEDNNSAPGVLIEADSPVTWTYEVTNEGDVALSNVTVTDDNGTPADDTDDVLLGYLAGYVSGDTNLDAILDVDETWIFEATGTATAGQYTNDATAAGTPPAVTNADGSTTTPDPVTADDPDNYFGIDPAITIVKTTNTVDNDTQPGILVNAGDPITWTYTVTNPGNVPLSNLTITDDNGTPVDDTDDFLVGYLAGYISGDTNLDAILDTDETWILQASGTAIDGDYTNDAVVQATPPTVTNPDGSTSTPAVVTDNNPDTYRAADPQIVVVKTTNTQDNNTQPGVLINPGDPVTWTYAVTNPGNVPLSDVTVSDDNGTPADDTDDLDTNYLSGDTNDDNVLDLDETWIFEATGTAISGPYANNATASGTPPPTIDETGTSIPESPVNAEDPDTYLGVDPEITVVKTTNTVDNNATPGVYITPGDAVIWTYTVTNTGNVPLSNVTVTDDNGTPADDTDDLLLGYLAGYVSGDTNLDAILDLDETWIFEATGTATAGQYTNNAVAQGTPPDTVDPSGDPVASDPIDADDPDNYFGTEPGIDLVKLTVATDNPTGTGPYVQVGDTVTWTYEVSNTGNVPLHSVLVTDDAGTPGTGDDFAPAYASGDTDDDGLLDIDEIWTFEASAPATVGQYVNNAQVVGTPPAITDTDGTTSTPFPVVAEDDDRYWGADPGITILKAVNGSDANEAPGIYVREGDAVEWTYLISNTGNTPLIFVDLADDMGVQLNCPTSTLAVGEDMLCIGTSQRAILGQYTNIGSVTATPAEPCDCPDEYLPIVDPDSGQPIDAVTAEDPANYFGSGPAVEIEKQVCDLNDLAECDLDNPDHWVEVTVVPNNGDAMWRIAVTNTGNMTLVDVTVTDSRAPDCEQTRPTLLPGDTWAYTCVLTDLVESTTNTAVVDASTIGDLFPPVTDEDTAETIEPAELELEKQTPVTAVYVGDTVTYTLSISNTGVTDAVDIEVLDTLPSGLQSISLPADSGLSYDQDSHTITWAIPSLPVGLQSTVSYTAVVTGLGSVINDAEVLSNHEENDLTNNMDTSTVTAQRRPVPSTPDVVLAFTGSSTRITVTFALVLMLLGAALMFVSRRRDEDPAV